MRKQKTGWERSDSRGTAAIICFSKDGNKLKPNLNVKLIKKRLYFDYWVEPSWKREEELIKSEFSTSITSCPVETGPVQKARIYRKSLWYIYN